MTRGARRHRSGALLPKAEECPRTPRTELPAIRRRRAGGGGQKTAGQVQGGFAEQEAGHLASACDDHTWGKHARVIQELGAWIIRGPS